MQTSAHRSGSIAHFSVAVQAQKADYICIMNTRAQQLEAFGRLLDIMDDLRQNCPWDRKQTFESLRHLTIEETYELADAILDKDVEEIRKETGDLLLHMVFYAKIGSELPEKKGRFDIADALNGICDKLIDRHPHIYGDVDAADEETVKANWEKLKLKEGKSSVLQGVPKSLPSLVKAYRVQDKVRGVGFDWDNAAQVWAKVKEELDELREELDASKQNQERITDEFGDVLFALINYARFVDVNPDEALERTTRRFIARFQHLEKSVREDGKDLTEMPLAEMDVYWEKAKAALND